MAWTRERLEEVARTRLGGAKLVVVANREPFIHVYEGEEIRCMRPASGLTTALDPMLRACSGTWVAHGSGDADRAVTSSPRSCGSRWSCPGRSRSAACATYASRWLTTTSTVGLECFSRKQASSWKPGRRTSLRARRKTPTSRHSSSLGVFGKVEGALDNLTW